MIEVRLFATFRDGREKILSMDEKQYENVREIARHLNIPIDEIAILLINGRHSSPDVPLSDGDIVALFPPVGGG